MSKFDTVWHTWMPEALRLRELGLTPQQICTNLAWRIFNDKKKFNTVKGWYKRTFPDWPSEEDTTSLNEPRPRLSGIPYQQQQPAGYHPKATPALLPSQYQQNYPQTYGVQQASISGSFQRPIGFPHQAEYLNPQLQDAATHTSFQQDLHQNPATGLFQHTTSAASHNMSRQGRSQNHPNPITSQISIGHFNSQYQQHVPRDQYGNVSHLQAGVVEQPRQQDYAQYHQHSHSQYAQQTPYGGHQARRDCLPGPGELIGRDKDQKSPSFEKNPAGYQLALESGSFATHMDPYYFVPMDNNDGGVNLPVDGQQSTMQGAVVPDQFVRPSEGQYLNTQPPDHRSVSESGAGSFATSPSNIYQAYASPSHQYQNGAVAVQNERSHTSATHYRSNPVLSNPTPPPQYPLPPVPSPKFGVIHKGPNQSWRPIRMDGNSMVKVNPNEFPTDHRRKRARGKIANETRDSIALYQKQYLEGTHAIPIGSPASYAAQTSAARNPLVNRPVTSSNVSVHSSLRDSGYISNFDSAVLESIRSSLSSFTLADDPNLNTDYKEDDDGYVEVEVQAKWRVRKSYLEKRDSSIVIISD